MEKVFVAQRVANQLFATEAAIDKSLVEATALISQMVQAQQELGLSTVFGDQAMSKVSEAISALAQARHAAVEAHSELAEAKLRLGIRTKLGGTGEKPQVQPSATMLREAV
jgi:hypothetical protein